MNTADRSVGHLDYALRRRFAFVHCGADVDVLTAQKHPASAAAVKLFGAVQKLFTDSILSKEFSKDDVQIGHTYFLVKSDTDAKAELVRKFVYQVYPILREYVKDGILRQPDDGHLSLPGLSELLLDIEMPPQELHQLVDDWLASKSDDNG